MKQSPSSGGMTTQDTATTVEIRDRAYGTTPVFWWGWPDEARLIAFAAQADRAEQDDQAEQGYRTMESNLEYAALYFVS